MSSRPIIKAYMEKGFLTSEETAEIFTQTATEQRFLENPYVVRFIESMREDTKYPINNNEELFNFYYHIAHACHRPTLIKHLEQDM